jgi:hypothetical protein
MCDQNYKLCVRNASDSVDADELQIDDVSNHDVHERVAVCKKAVVSNRI